MPRFSEAGEAQGGSGCGSGRIGVFVVFSVSHLAPLQEIADNDYNLNIPRYVDTFEEEEEIDIKAVMADIKELEAKRSELDAQIEVYLRELGIVE